jgi:hypothetical protein
MGDMKFWQCLLKIVFLDVMMCNRLVGSYFSEEPAGP